MEKKTINFDSVIDSAVKNSANGHAVVSTSDVQSACAYLHIDIGSNGELETTFTPSRELQPMTSEEVKSVAANLVMLTGLEEVLRNTIASYMAERGIAVFDNYYMEQRRKQTAYETCEE